MGRGTETLQVFAFYEHINAQLHYQRLTEHQQIHRVTNGRPAAAQRQMLPVGKGEQQIGAGGR